MPSGRFERLARRYCAPGFRCLTGGRRIGPCGAQLRNLRLNELQRLLTRQIAVQSRPRKPAQSLWPGWMATPARVVNPFSARSHGIGPGQRTRLRTPPYVARTSPVYRCRRAISISHLDTAGRRDRQRCTACPCRNALCVSVRKCAPTRAGPRTVSSEVGRGRLPTSGSGSRYPG